MTPEPDRFYRLYSIGMDGHIVGRTEIACADDAEVISRARQLVDGHAIEIWLGTRRVGFVEPDK